MQGNSCQLVAILFKDSPLWSQPYLQELNIWIKRTTELHTNVIEKCVC